MPPAYNILTDDEVAHCLPEFTAEEEEGRVFNKQMPHRYCGLMAYVHYYFREIGWKAVLIRVPGLKQRSDEFERRLASSFSQGHLRLFQMAHLVRRHSPRLIYEFGAGRTSYFWGELLRHNHLVEGGPKGLAVCFEQNPLYYDRLQSIFPNELREYVDIRLERVRVGQFGNYRALHFDFPVPAAVDLVYVDGPTTPASCRELGDRNRVFLNGDLLRLVQQGCRVRRAFTDHRWANYPMYRHFLGATHTVEASRWWKSILAEER